jgi:hypothetical protein
MTIAALILFLLQIGGWAQTTTTLSDKKQDAVEAELLRLEEIGRQKALTGSTEWDSLMADGAYMTGPDGNVALYEKGKAFPPFPLVSFKLSELIARNYGDTGVVTGLAEIEVMGPDKKIVSFKMRYLNVWRKYGDGWKIAVSQRTSVTAPPRPKQ